MSSSKVRIYARKKKSEKTGVIGLGPVDDISSTLLEGSQHQLGSRQLSYLTLLKADTWSTLETKDSGVRIHIEGDRDPYIRLDRLSQKQLAGNVRKMLSHHIIGLVRIYNRDKLHQAFAKWRSAVVSSRVRFCFRYKSSARHAFLMWKTYSRSRRLRTWSRKQGCVVLGCVLWRANNERVKRALGRWREAVRDIKRLLHRSFDNWSLWTLKSKLRKYNVLKVFKSMLERRAHRSHKRIRWYFEHWRSTAATLARLQTLQMCMDSAESDILCSWKARVRDHDGAIDALDLTRARRLLRRIFSLWTATYTCKQKLKNFHDERELTLLRSHWRCWKRFYASRRALRTFLTRHIARARQLKGDERVPVEVDVVTPADDVPVARCVRKSCRCVKCLSRYGHLGARTTDRRYEMASASEVYASPRLSWNSSMPSANVSQGPESVYSLSWNTVHSTGPEAAYRPRSPKRTKLRPYDIAIPESQCSFMEHLEIRLNDLTNLAAEFEQRKEAITAAGGKRVVTNKKPHLNHRNRPPDANYKKTSAKGVKQCNPNIASPTQSILEGQSVISSGPVVVEVEKGGDDEDKSPWGTSSLSMLST